MSLLYRHLERSPPNYFVYNLGTGVGVSVLEMVKGMEKVLSFAKNPHG